jgi:hypothetical protein
MNVELVKKLHETLIKKTDGCQFLRMDLHVHTPASRCFARNPSLSEQDDYLAIIDQALAHNIRILAITDHNTFSGYQRLCEILASIKKLDYPTYKAKNYGQLFILPGIEISNFGKHFLGIFPPEIFLKDSAKLEKFLLDIGIETAEQGEKNAEAFRVTPIVLLEKIHALGGLVILPHANSPSGFLEGCLDVKDKDNKLQGKSVAAILQSPQLSAISFTSKQDIPKFNQLIKNKEYHRASSLAVIYCSDYHGAGDGIKQVSGKPIGEKYSVIKITKPSFHGLKIALEDPETRIMDCEPKINHPYIMGITVQGQFFGKKENAWEYFRFNPWLNCLIGARGTGKSTLLNILQFALYGKMADGNDSFLKLFDQAVAFAQIGENVFAISVSPQHHIDGYTETREKVDDKRKIYIRNKSGNFSVANTQSTSTQEALALFLTASSYQQAELYNLGKDILGPVNIIDHLIQIRSNNTFRSINAEINQLTESLQTKSHEYFEEKRKFKSSNADLIELIKEDYAKLLDAREKLQKLRADVVEQINQALSGQVDLSLETRFEPNWIKKQAEAWVGAGARGEYRSYQQNNDSVRLLERAFRAKRWVLPLALFLNDPELLAENTPGIKVREAKELLRSPAMRQQKTFMWDMFPDDLVDFRYNTMPIGTTGNRFIDRGSLSLGQNTVALLLIILTAGRFLDDSRPLMMDQPEDNLDNQYIYTELVKEIRESKQTRQMIFSTHNPNIPIAGDAEKIFILEASEVDGGKIADQGSVDTEKISTRVMDILEGGAEALARRAMKYPNFADRLPQ